jgi:hypothetical protein
MKAYLCLEGDKEAVGVEGLPKEVKDRKTFYFVVKAENSKKAEEEAKSMGAKVVRVLTKEEALTEEEDGSYDIEL